MTARAFGVGDFHAHDGSTDTVTISIIEPAAKPPLRALRLSLQEAVTLRDLLDKYLEQRSDPPHGLDEVDA